MEIFICPLCGHEMWVEDGEFFCDCDFEIE